MRRLAFKGDFPYDMVCIPVPDIYPAHTPNPKNNPYNSGCYQVVMRVYYGKDTINACMLYEAKKLLYLKSLSDNAVQLELWKLAMDCSKALYNNPYKDPEWKAYPSV